jgi:hypothetical protein
MNIFEVTIEDDRIIVSAGVEPYNSTKNPRKSIHTGDIEKRLTENGVEFGKCIKESYLNNRESSSLEGTWIFEKKKLDKSVEEVILTKEEKPAPKKRKSRAKKKTTK